MTRTELPRFSIIIPTYARPGPLAVCLKSLERLTYPRDRFEVIIVDDGSPTSPRAVIEPHRATLNIALRSQPNAGPATARNTGAALARGEVLAFTDDDCAPAPDWLERLDDALVLTPEALVGGRVVNALTGNIYSAASQSLVSYLYHYYNADGRSARFFTSNNFAIRSDRFREVGGFDTTYPRAAAEDREFCDRWVHLGRQMVYASDVVVHHSHNLSFRSFWRQHFNYGRGAYSFREIRSRRDAETIRVEPASFYWNLLCYPFRQSNSRHAPWLSSLMIVSQIANTLGFFVEQARQKKRVGDDARIIDASSATR